MASTKISALTDGVTANATDDIGAARAGGNVRIQPGYIRTYLLALANTWAATQTITPAVNTNALAVTGYSLTGANAQSLVDVAGTWNTSGTPTLISAQVTDTASNASSKLMSLIVGAVARHDMFKDFSIGYRGYFSSTDYVQLNYGSLLWTKNALGVSLKLEGDDGGHSTSAGKVAFGSGGVVSWQSTARQDAGVIDVSLVRTAASILGVRAATSSAGAAISLLEQTAPAGATNEARLYAEDNGSGKTKLMVIMPTGAAIQLAIEP